MVNRKKGCIKRFGGKSTIMGEKSCPTHCSDLAQQYFKEALRGSNSSQKLKNDGTEGNLMVLERMKINRNIN